VTRILLVDDDADVLAFMTDALRERGFAVQVLQSSAQAASVIAGDHFDLIVTDIVMPKVHGLQILQSAKQRNPDTPVIFVTGHPHRDILREGFEQGAFSVLEKPFTVSEFLTTVDRALAGRD